MVSPSEFINTYEEIHAGWEGFADSLSWSRKPGEPCTTDSLMEPHYYRFGYLGGKICQAVFWVSVGVILTKIILIGG